MSHDVIMPQLGMSQDSAVIVGWRKAVGDAVAKGETLFEVETDKAIMEVEARQNGFVAAILAGADHDVPVGQCIGVIVDSADQIDSVAAALSAGDTAHEPTSDDTAPVDAAVETPIETQPSTPALARVDGRVLASPKAKRLARERGIDLTELLSQGLVEPLHAADIPLEPSTHGATQAQSASSASGLAPSAVLSARCQSEALDELLDWLQHASASDDRHDAQPVSRAQLWASFCAAARPDAQINATVSVSERFSPSTLWSVQGRALRHTHALEPDSAHPVDWQVHVLSGTRIDSYTTTQAASVPSIVITGEPQHTTLSLHFNPETLPMPTAAQWLDAIAMRCQHPVYHLF